MVRPIVIGQGTPEAEWRTWPAVTRWPALPLDAATPPLVVAPHPDDEILGVAGLMTMLGGADIVAVTDGEASHPHSTVYTPTELAAVRRAETTEALSRLGLRHQAVHRLGQPDGSIDEGGVTEALAALLFPERWCVVTWRADGHPDHEAVGHAAARACATAGARLLEYPIWAWHWARPDDPDVPWHRAHRIDLTSQARARKRAAIAAFVSQITALGPTEADAAILPPHVLERFDRPYETVFA